MKQRLSIGIQDFIKVFENLDKIADILGVTADVYGITVVTKRGFLKSIEEKYVLTYTIVKDLGGYVITFRLSEAIDPVARIRVRGIHEGCEIVLECLSNKHLCRCINDIIKKLTKNSKKVLEKIKGLTTRSEAKVKFSLTSRYAKVIDGLAEVTLSSLYLRYPLLDRKIMKLDEVKNVEEFLDTIYRLYSRRLSEAYIHVSASNWMLILAVDLVNKEYTPSLIENNSRVVGIEALNKFKVKEDPVVTVSILAMQS